MLPIDKGAPPGCLGQLRRALRAEIRRTGKQPRANAWAPGDCAQPIRDALHRDQRGLCGYCMQRIEPQGHRDLPPPGNWGMRIEHITPRDPAVEHGDPAQMYDWQNLLGVCGGRSPSTNEPFDHCDRTRGSQALTVDPTTQRVDLYFRYPREGNGLAIRVRADAPCDQAAVSTDLVTLCLNHKALCRRRLDALNDLRTRLGRSKNVRQTLTRAWDRLGRADGPLPEFAGVLRVYVARKLRQRGL